MFQCSSASRKFLNPTATGASPLRCCFSALQRAENSSILIVQRPELDAPAFQCSSASRKFLNFLPTAWTSVFTGEFQCSSASRKFLNEREALKALQALFVSVLFSEPKIPQLEKAAPQRRARWRFSALQRAENSSMGYEVRRRQEQTCFSALQRAENSSILLAEVRHNCAKSFSALQRAENSSIVTMPRSSTTMSTFQCSSASRKFLNLLLAAYNALQFFVSVLFSEPKIPQS